MQEIFNYLWAQTGLSFTPKLNRMLTHADEHMTSLEHIEDMLEDDSVNQLLIGPGKNEREKMETHFSKQNSSP
jgi:hypothetical protein